MRENRNGRKSTVSVVKCGCKTADYGEIYVSFWDDGKDWSLQTEEEMGFEQTEDLSEEPGMSMTM